MASEARTRKACQAICKLSFDQQQRERVARDLGATTESAKTPFCKIGVVNANRSDAKGHTMQSKLRQGDSIHIGDNRYTVGEPCEFDDRGHWMCATHDMTSFDNNLAMWWHRDEHAHDVRKQECDILWWCHMDGPEVVPITRGDT